MPPIVYLSIFILLLAGSVTADADDDKKRPALYSSQLSIKNRFQIVVNPPLDLKNFELKGKLRHSLQWQDRNGKQILLFTETGEFKSAKKCGLSCTDAELYAYHYKYNAGKYKLVRRVLDYEKECEYDLFIDFIPNSITLTDLDKNGIAELTFAYTKACISDVSPLEMKLIMLESNRKYALRGFSSNKYIESLTASEKAAEQKHSSWGIYKVDKAFAKAPASFLKFAKKRWQQLKVPAND